MGRKPLGLYVYFGMTYNSPTGRFNLIVMALLLVVLQQGRVSADALPKRVEKIELTYNTSTDLELDSASVMYVGNESDSLTRYSEPTIQLRDKHRLRIGRMEDRNFKVFLYFTGRVCSSPVLSYDDGPYYHLEINDKEVLEIQPFFKFSYLINYFIALLITILVECGAASLFFLGFKVPMRNLKIIVFASLISHPVLWTVCVNFFKGNEAFLVGEFFVIIFEAIFLRRFIEPAISPNKANSMSILINLTSLILGSFLCYIIFEMMDYGL